MSYLPRTVLILCIPYRWHSWSNAANNSFSTLTSNMGVITELSSEKLVSGQQESGGDGLNCMIPNGTRTLSKTG